MLDKLLSSLEEELGVLFDFCQEILLRFARAYGKYFLLLNNLRETVCNSKKILNLTWELTFTWAELVDNYGGDCTARDDSGNIIEFTSAMAESDWCLKGDNLMDAEGYETASLVHLMYCSVLDFLNSKTIGNMLILL